MIGIPSEEDAVSTKVECPGCGSYASSVAIAFQRGEPCPQCGLSARAAAEVLTVRASAADAQLRANHEQIVIALDKVTVERDDLARRLSAIQDALEGYES